MTFDSGADLAAAAATAAAADVAVVFGYYQEGEFGDRPNLSLDGGGDALIAAVAAANPNTVVVLQTGGPVLMPWLDSVDSVLEVWYAGEQMGPAIASLLWGDVSPSGKLTHTFPVSEADLPTAGSEAQYPGTLAADVPDGPASGRVHRGPAGRLPLVRRPGHRPAVPLRPRPDLHELRVRRSPGDPFDDDRRQEHPRQVPGHEHR